MAEIYEYLHSPTFLHGKAFNFIYIIRKFGALFAAWIMGWVICKTVPYLQGVSVSASINTLVAISVERCLAICYPLKWQMTSRACRVVVFLIWTFSLIITLPWAIFFRLYPLEEGSDIQVGLDVLLLNLYCSVTIFVRPL
jgi:hypothetical protein